jgi:hypothetical protein
VTAAPHAPRVRRRRPPASPSPGRANREALCLTLVVNAIIVWNTMRYDRLCPPSGVNAVPALGIAVVDMYATRRAEGRRGERSALSEPRSPPSMTGRRPDARVESQNACFVRQGGRPERRGPQLHGYTTTRAAASTPSDACGPCQPAAFSGRQCPRIHCETCLTSSRQNRVRTGPARLNQPRYRPVRRRDHRRASRPRRWPVARPRGMAAPPSLGLPKPRNRRPAPRLT